MKQGLHDKKTRFGFSEGYRNEATSKRDSKQPSIFVRAVRAETEMSFSNEWDAMSAGPFPDDQDVAVVQECIQQLGEVEDQVLGGILLLLEQEYELHKRNRDRSTCDSVFGFFSHHVLKPYADAGLVSKAADFAARKLIPAVLDLEKSMGAEFHKGALFYDTSLAFLASGDDLRFEYYLAMTDEEDFLTHGVEGKPQVRGMHNKKQGELSAQTIQAAICFAVDFLNGSYLSSLSPVSTILGSSLTIERMNCWRAGLDVVHHAELFRFLNEFRVFSGEDVPSYPAVRDNPYVMLRLSKVLAHLAQWSESRLTVLQSSATGDTLHAKLKNDPHLSSLASIAGYDSTNVCKFPGRKVQGPAIDQELKTLMAQIPIQTMADQREWRILRVLYIVRNSTAHWIDTTLAFYNDRQYLLDLIQIIFVSVFAIQNRKGLLTF